jgi:hypothetical protein
LHLTAVQEANRRFDLGEHPAMMRYSAPTGEYFEDLVEAIFAAPTKEDAMAIIEHYGGETGYWTEIIGTRGFKGKKAFNSNTIFNELFSEEVEVADEGEGEEFDESKLDALGETI